MLLLIVFGRGEKNHSLYTNSFTGEKSIFLFMPLCLRVSGICSLAVDVGKRGLPRQDRHNEKHIVLTLISSKIRLLTVRVAFYMVG